MFHLIAWACFLFVLNNHQKFSWIWERKFGWWSLLVCDTTSFVCREKDARLEEKSSEYDPPTKLKFNITDEMQEKIHEASAEYDSYVFEFSWFRAFLCAMFIWAKADFKNVLFLLQDHSWLGLDVFFIRQIWQEFCQDAETQSGCVLPGEPAACILQVRSAVSVCSVAAEKTCSKACRHCGPAAQDQRYLFCVVLKSFFLLLVKSHFILQSLWS